MYRALQAWRGADLPAGQEVSVRPPTPGLYRLQALVFGLVTSSAVANRRPTLLVEHDGVEVYRVSAPADQAASTTRTYVAAPHGRLDADTTANVVLLALPVGLVITDKTVLRTSTLNLQADDDYTAPTLWVAMLEQVRDTDLPADAVLVYGVR